MSPTIKRVYYAPIPLKLLQGPGNTEAVRNVFVLSQMEAGSEMNCFSVTLTRRHWRSIVEEVCLDGQSHLRKAMETN